LNHDLVKIIQFQQWTVETWSKNIEHAIMFFRQLINVLNCIVTKKYSFT